jgi:hypothetical protein
VEGRNQSQSRGRIDARCDTSKGRDQDDCRKVNQFTKRGWVPAEPDQLCCHHQVSSIRHKQILSCQTASVSTAPAESSPLERTTCWRACGFEVTRTLHRSTSNPKVVVLNGRASCGDNLFEFNLRQSLHFCKARGM